MKTWVSAARRARYKGAMRFSTLILAALVLTGCNRKPEPTSQEPSAAPLAAAEPAPTPRPAPAPTGEPVAGGLTWEAPAPFVRETPKSPMRAAQYRIGEGEQAAEMTVFFFGPGQGGSVEDNIDRWVGQFAQPDGSDPKKAARIEKKDVSGLKVTTIALKGTYGGMQMPGAPPQPPIEDARLLGAIVEGPEGPVFFKMVGPATTVEGAEEPFDALVDSMKAR